MVNLISFSIKKRLRKDYEKWVIEWHKKHINEGNEEDFKLSTAHSQANRFFPQFLDMDAHP